MVFKGSFEFDSAIVGFRCISWKDFEELKKRASRVYDEVIETYLQSDANLKFVCLHGIVGSYSSPKQVDLLGYQVIVNYSL